MAVSKTVLIQQLDTLLEDFKELKSGREVNWLVNPEDYWEKARTILKDAKKLLKKVED